jgi:hypothetical protein
MNSFLQQWFIPFVLAAACVALLFLYLRLYA